MNTITPIIVAAFGLLLMAVTDSRADTLPFKETPLIFIGDSICYGTGVEELRGYPVSLGDRGYGIDNRCWPGATFRDWQFDIAPHMLLDLDGATVIVALGTNGAIGLGEPSPIEPEEHGALARRLFNELLVQGAVGIIAVEPVPNLLPVDSPQLNRLLAYPAVLREVCSSLEHVECVGFELSLEEDFFDEVHWSTSGHEIAADEIEAVLLPEADWGWVAALLTLASLLVPSSRRSALRARTTAIRTLRTRPGLPLLLAPRKVRAQLRGKEARHRRSQDRERSPEVGLLRSGVVLPSQEPRRPEVPTSRRRKARQVQSPLDPGGQAGTDRLLHADPGPRLRHGAILGPAQLTERRGVSQPSNWSPVSEGSQGPSPCYEEFEPL